MIDKFCTYLTKKIRKKMPEIDNERAEIIQYGIQLIIGEMPKLILIVGLAFILKIGWLLLFTYCALLPYRICSGGFHCKTHIGCFITTCTMYYGIIYISKYLILQSSLKYLIVLLAAFFGMIIISLYAPADTENVPILSKKERKKKKILSYVFLVINLIISLILKDNVISNILLFGTLIQTCTITRIAYKLSNNKYGYEIYQ